MPDLRLGATIEHEGSVLEFSRIKANKQTMQDRSGKPLPDGALSPYLGANDRDFFTQMFSLDHQRLVEGGLSILSASNDLGQILFQHQKVFSREDCSTLKFETGNGIRHENRNATRYKIENEHRQSK